jgi:hypothetical protein
LQAAYNERDRLMISFKKKYEDEAVKLTESEREANGLEINLRALTKQNEI